jgi:hypothetical protein
MIDFLLESPWSIAMIGAIVTAALLYGWMQTGHRSILLTSLGVVIATILLVATGLWIDTAREEVQRFVLDTARELETNQWQKVVAKIHPQAGGELQDAKSRLPSIRFRVARVKAIHRIEVQSNRAGRSAIIQMNAIIEAESDSRQGTIPRWVQLNLEESNGEWLIVAFEHREPHYQMLNEHGRQRLDDLRR